MKEQQQTKVNKTKRLAEQSMQLQWFDGNMPRWMIYYLFLQSLLSRHLLAKAGTSVPVLDLATFDTGQQGVVMQGGAVVSCAGDVNGDGLSDILIGSPSAWPGGIARALAGASYLLYGGTFSGTVDLQSLHSINGVVIQGAAIDDKSGISVSSAGDVNGDGLSDILIGAYLADPQGRDYAGAAYLLYGGTFSETVDLASLSATQGLLIQGMTDTRYSGYYVASAGDVNGDGLSDILIGTRQDSGSVTAVYLIYGGTFSSNVDLENISSTAQGVVILGGAVVSYAGDVNGDGLSDILIGAPYAYTLAHSMAGVSYLLYGGTFSGILNLNNLAPNQGVVIQGAAGGDRSGNSLASVGDVNGDGLPDILIGAPSASPKGRKSAGISYLLFGGTFSETVDLARLTPTQGVVIQGALASDKSGFSVSSAGDVNGDGLSDILIGASRATKSTSTETDLYPGITYLLFGGAISGIVDLGSLNSTQGVVIQGVAVYDHRGFAVSSAGDVNGDGLSDILVGDPTNKGTGKSYLIFGPLRPYLLNLINSSLICFNDAPTLLTSDMLDIQHAQNDTVDVQLQIQEVRYGHFESYHQPGIPIPAFYQSNITQGDIQFIPNGDELVPTIKLQLQYHLDAYWYTFQPEIVFDYIPVLSMPTWFIIQTLGARIHFSESHLLLTDSDNDNTVLQYTVINTDHVQFERTNTSSVPIDTFTQAEVNAGEIVFVHDGIDASMPFYTFTFTDGLYVSPLQDGRVELNIIGEANAAPSLVNNVLSIHEGQRIALTTHHLSAADSDNADESLVFSVHDIAHGQFEHVDMPDEVITSFTQQDILDQVIVFVHDGSEVAPQYSIVVSDGDSQTIAEPADIQFAADMNDAPKLRLSEWVIQQGQTFVLTSESILAIDSDNEPAALVFQVKAIQYGDFYREGEDAALLLFTQADIDAGKITFRHDGSENTPSVTLAVNDGVVTSEDKNVIFRFISNKADAQISSKNNLQDNPLLWGGVGAAFVSMSACLSVGFFSYHRRAIAKLSRAGDEHVIPRTVYEALKIKGVDNFQSVQGLRFVAQLQDLTALYDKRYGGLPSVKVDFAECLADAILKTCSLQKDRFNRVKITLSDDEQVSPLKVHAETIISQTHRNLTQGSQHLQGRVNPIPVSKLYSMNTEMGFLGQRKRKSQRTSASFRANSERRHSKRVSYSVPLNRSRSNSRDSKQILVGLPYGYGLR